jgi:hypothetical protein
VNVVAGCYNVLVLAGNLVVYLAGALIVARAGLPFDQAVVDVEERRSVGILLARDRLEDIRLDTRRDS